MYSSVNVKQNTRINFKDVNKQKIKALKEEMTSVEKIIWDKKIPVIIFVESESEKLKSDIIKNIISSFETITYNLILPYTKSNNDIHFMMKYWKDISAKGKVKLYYNSPYNEVIFSKLENNISNHQFENKIRQLNIFERQLSDDGYVIVKLFLHNGNNFSDIKNSNGLSFKYSEFEKTVDKILNKTSTSSCPWNVLNGKNKYNCIADAYTVIINSIKQKIQGADNFATGQVSAEPFLYDFNTIDRPKLSEIKQEYMLLKNEYKLEMKKQQTIFASNVKKLKKKDISLVLAFEGWDASGKGGNIKRIIKPLEPLDYKVVPVATPTQEELSKHYLWRFYKKISDKGNVTLFDRTWYGRVLVERVEKITPENRCKQAFREINEFEKQLYDNKTIILKFWFHINKDEQLKRFEARQNDETRRWKICDDDWRNRDKWNDYEKYADEMIEKTSTDFAPWNVIGANDKRHGRIECLKTINCAIKNYLENKDNK